MSEETEVRLNAHDLEKVTGGEMFPQIEIKLLGNFQLMNVLCAIALAMASGINSYIEYLLKSYSTNEP